MDRNIVFDKHFIDFEIEIKIFHIPYFGSTYVGLH